MKTFLVFALLLQGALWTADEQKAAMNDASDLQEDVRDALGNQAGAKVSEAALKLEGIMGRTEDYWTAKKQADVVKLAQASRALARQLADEGASGKLEEAVDTFRKLNATCGACHDLHPEKR